MNELISLIIPAYNVEKYISRCIQSVIAQTYTNWELIIVNDGSTDNTIAIIGDFLKSDKRIKLLNNSDQGVCTTRNLGLSVVKGEWFGFIDADDWVEPTFLETLYKNAIENDCSVSACRYIIDLGDYIVNDSDYINDIMLIESESKCIHNFICDGLSMEGMVWNKIYRTTLYKDCLFDPKIRVNEDCKYTFEVMSKCKSACLTTARLYHWFHRHDSASRRKAGKIELDNAKVFLDLLDRTAYLGDEELTKKLKTEYVTIIFKMFLTVKYSYDNPSMLEIRKRLIDWRDDVWPLLNTYYQKYYYFLVYHPLIMNCIRIRNGISENIKRYVKNAIGKK